MIINKLYLKKFGKFENKEIEFSNGLNVFSGKNESGKSTIATALKTFFYTELNGKGKYKKNYIPLSSDKGIFDVFFTTDNNKKFVSLVNLGKTNGKTLVKTIDEATGEAIDGDSSKNGELFFSLSEDMFDSVCYIKDLTSVSNVIQNKTQVHDKLSKTENNILDIDLSDVIKKVKDELALMQRKTKSGRIFPLEERLLVINNALSELTSVREALKNTDEKISNLKNEEITLKENLKGLSLKEEYLSKYKEYKNAKEQLKLREEIKILKGSLDKETSFTDIPKNDLDKIRAYAHSIKEENRNYALPLVLAAVVIALSLGLSFINALFGAVSLLSIPLFILSYKNKRMNEIAKSRKEEYTSLLEKHNIESEEDYTSKKEEFLKKENEKNLILQKIEFLTSKLTDYNKEFEECYLDEPSVNESELSALKEKTTRRLTEIIIEENSLIEKKKAAFNNMPDFYLLSEEKEELVKTIEKLKEEESVAADCLNILNITNDSFKSSYIPYLSKEVKNILNEISKESIDYFNITNDLYCEIRRESSENVLSNENFSRGTDALIYFALRLAIYKLVSKEEKIPLILDDCFAELDDERFKKVVEYLDKNVDGQIIYFTAHERIFNLTLANTTIFRL